MEANAAPSSPKGSLSRGAEEEEKEKEGTKSPTSPNGKKRAREPEQTSPREPAVVNNGNDGGGSISSKPDSDMAVGKGNDGAAADAADDLLVPLAGFDWSAFLSKCQAELKEVEGEEAALLEEYHSWEWLHKLWTTCRSQSESVRLAREIATIAKWTQLKEAEVEEARIRHTEDMQKISSVLGIATMFSPPPGK